VAQSHPQSEEAGLALFRAARIYTRLFKLSGKQQDLDDAIELYRRVVYDYPHHRIADDAQFGIGQIYYEQKNDLSQAYVEFLKVDIKYPEGDMRPKAKVMLEKIADTMSRKDERKTGKEFSQSPSSHSVQVQGIRHWSTPSYTRVVIDLERPVTYESKLLKEDKAQNKPGRLYMDLRGAHVPSDINTAIPISDGLLKSARAAQYSRDSVRVVMDIESIELQDFMIPIESWWIRGTNATEQEKTTPREAKEEKRGARKGVRRADKPDEQVSMARQLGLTVKKIVVDPGHGGKDPGSLLDSGLYEKEIVLSLAQILAKKMEERLGVEVTLTRNRDVFLPLEKRTAFANMQKADLFLSLHINAHKQADVSGLETYFLNMATDERAVMVAARENATSEKNISDLQKILNDLMLNTKISESSKLAHEVKRDGAGEEEV
jgi:N-acetylmuramoyl-L-alanine amidase